MKKLHLGSGGLNIPGYINTDVLEKEGVDLVLNVTEIPYPFDDNTLDEVFSAHLVEHLPLQKLPEIIAEWRRILKVGGKVICEVPDLKGGIDLYLKGNYQVAMDIFYGKYEGHETDRHMWGWTYETLAPYFTGFSTEHKPTLDYHWHNFGIPTFRIEATKL